MKTRIIRTGIIFLLLFITGLVFDTPRPALAGGVVGSGTSGSCTQAALETALAGGGTITFNCGGAKTITLTSTLQITTTTTIDGGGLITLSGGNSVRIIRQTATSVETTLTLKNLTLQNGRASGAQSAANGGAVQSIYQGKAPTLIIDHVTFTGNVANQTTGSGINMYDFGGGAIYSQGGFVEITDSTFTNNDALLSGGGAIHLLQSAATISGSTFTGNSNTGSTGQGGVIYIDGMNENGGGYVTITDSRFEDNSGTTSGGVIYVNMYHTSDTLTVNRTSFIDNTLDGGLGGAISGGATGSVDPKVVITNSLFSGNIATQPSNAPSSGGGGSGGALAFVQRADITIANSTFYNNQARYTGVGTQAWNANGGALYVGNNSVAFKVYNSTFANNFAGWVGGAIVGSNGRIRNTLFANNSANNGGNGWNIQQTCSTELTNDGNNMQTPGKTAPGDSNDHLCATGITVANPNLQALADNSGPTQTMALAVGSPAIDAGSNTGCAASPVNNLDQRGALRPVDGDGNTTAVCDIGAFESSSGVPPLIPALKTPTNGASLTSTTALLDWDAANGATEYDLQFTRSADTGFSSPLFDDTLTTTSWTTPFLTAGAYRWRVRASSIFGASEWSGAFTFNITSSSSAAPTRNLFTDSTPTLYWEGVPGATGYQVQVARNSSFSSIAFSTSDSGGGVLSSGTLTVTPSPALDPGVYYWRVRARKADGVTWGSWSSSDSFVIGLP